MSAFIAVVWAKKLKNLPQPDVRGLQNTGTHPNLGCMEVNLAKQVMELTP
jgi:hypothetical protein